MNIICTKSTIEGGGFGGEGVYFEINIQINQVNKVVALNRPHLKSGFTRDYKNIIYAWTDVLVM